MRVRAYLITYEIWNNTAIRISPSWVVKEVFPIGIKICPVRGVDVVIISCIKERISKDE